MKFSQFLCKGSPLRFLRMQWRHQSKQKVMNTKMHEAVLQQGFRIYDPKEIIEEKPVSNDFDWSSVVSCIDPLPEKNKDHPCWNDTPCLVYRDNNVLVEGLPQAMVLTNTVEVKEGLPDQIKALEDKVTYTNQDNLVRSSLMSALVYDGVQEKLPKRKDPLRPAINLPRDYGIPDKRKNLLICSKLLHLCEMIVGHEISQHRCTFTDSLFQLYLKRDDLIQLQLTADLLLTADKPLEQIVDPKESLSFTPPDLAPLIYTISLDEDNFYKIENIYPINDLTQFNNLHTAIIYHNESEVANLYDLPVLETQIIGRSLMKAFVFAATKAKSQYGEDIGELPKPITVQCVQTNGTNYHFSIFQLNTLEWIPKSGLHNIFWSHPHVPLYQSCGYVNAVPSLESYNPEVFKKLLAFYLNGANLL